MFKKLKVFCIEDQGDRILFYEPESHFHVIGDHKTAGDVGVGDTILYEPGGINFGWFVSKVTKGDKHD